MFPDINFSNDDYDYSGDPANESSLQLLMVKIIHFAKKC